MMIHSRKGQEWQQMFMVFLFVLILIVAITLLLLDLKSINPQREQMGADLLDQEANVQLINLMRYQASGGYQGDGRKAPIADIITLNTGQYDDMLLDSMTKAVPQGYYYEIFITYPDSTLLISNTEYKEGTKQMLRERGPSAVRGISETEKQSQVLPESLATTLLPSGPGTQPIKVELFISRKLGDDKAAPRIERSQRGAQ